MPTKPGNTRLSRRFFSQPTASVARKLLGCMLISDLGGQRTSGVVVETEAYLHDDPACHAFKARTARTEVMFGMAGVAYVYPIHAKYCFNIVSEKKEVGCAVLIRALQPVLGIEYMQKRRGVEAQRRLTTGPACLCQALSIDRTVNGFDLTRSKKLWLERGETPSDLGKVGVSNRIGVTSGEKLQLRFYIRGNPFVSGTKAMRQ